jgi:replicative DNA helicase
MSSGSSIYKTPPNDVDAEKSVLGAVLIDSSSINNVAEILRTDHFYVSEHKLIFQAMLELFEKRNPIDVVTLKDQLTKSGTLKEVGGASYLTELLNAVPTSAYSEHYANIVKSMYVKRKLIEVASKSVETAFENTGEIQELIDSVESSIFALASEYQHRDFVPMKEILVESFEKLEEFLKTGKTNRGIPTGFTALDNKLAGLHKSNLVILAARPGVGKTTFALNIALHAALKEKKPVN